jgi:cytochrome c peroxidase
MRFPIPAVLIGAFALAIVWWDQASAPGEMAFEVPVPGLSVASGPVRPLPASPALDPERVELGQRLFRDPQLSGDGSISCASCHSAEHGGADGRVRPVGIDGRIGEVNTPTVFNAALGFRQFWDGRAVTLEEQIEGPLTSPGEMGSSWEHVLSQLRANSDYVRAFASAYPDGISEANVRDAIASFERALVTPDSRFDQHLRGKPDALTPDELRGWDLFQDYGCIGCHQGSLLGGNMFQRLGIVRDYFADRGGVEKADLGRFNVTGLEEDRHVFKVPSLRNVALTAPYFHDGSAATLEEAVRVMARYQLGRSIDEPDLASVVAFLGALTGKPEISP